MPIVNDNPRRSGGGRLRIRKRRRRIQKAMNYETTTSSDNDFENITFNTIEKLDKHRFSRPHWTSNLNESYNIDLKHIERENRNIKDRSSISTLVNPTHTNNLRQLLKKTEQSSLSEILQQNNLSLQDLLQGKHQVIEKLSPPVVNYQQRKKFIIASNNSSIKITANKTKEDNKDTDEDEQTEKTVGFVFGTEKPIREVLSRIRPDLTNSHTTRLPIIQQKFKKRLTCADILNPNGSSRPIQRRRGFRSARYEKCLQMVSTTIATTREEEIITTSTDTPLVNFQTNIKNSVKDTEENREFFYKSSNSHKYNLFSNGVGYDQSNEINENSIDDADEADIIELLRDPRAGYKFAKILASRNMSIDELFQHRRRGSSHLHLRDSTHVLRPIAQAQTVDHPKIVTAFDNFPMFNVKGVKSVKPDEIKTDSEGLNYFTSIIEVKPTSD